MAEFNMSIEDFNKKLKNFQKCKGCSEEEKVDQIRKLICKYANTHDKILLLKSENKDSINSNPVNSCFTSIGFCISLYGAVISFLLEIGLFGIIKIIPEGIAFVLVLLMVIFSTKLIYVVSDLSKARKYAFLLEQLIEEHENKDKKQQDKKEEIRGEEE